MPSFVEIASAVHAGDAILQKTSKAAFTAKSFLVPSVFSNVKSANSKFAKAASFHVDNVKKIYAQNAVGNALYARIHFAYPALKKSISINAGCARRHSVSAVQKISENAKAAVSPPVRTAMPIVRNVKTSSVLIAT